MKIIGTHTIELINKLVV